MLGSYFDFAFFFYFCGEFIFEIGFIVRVVLIFLWVEKGALISYIFVLLRLLRGGLDFKLFSFLCCFSFFFGLEVLIEAKAIAVFLFVLFMDDRHVG